MANATYLNELELLQKYRKLQSKYFKEKETGHTYQLIYFSLEWGTGALTATMALSSHTSYKRNIPMAAFSVVFEPYDAHADREDRENAAII